MAIRREFLKNTSLAILGGAIAKKTSKSAKVTREISACDMTTLDYYGEGPFYSDNPPMLSNNKLATDDEPGQRMIISGRVLNLDCNEFIPDTVIDVWHADDEGNYDNNGFKLRGYTKTNGQGFYLFETILPGKYGNANQLRPSHIHFKITPPNFPELVTQLYFEGDDSIPTDAAASISTGVYDATDRIISLGENADGVLEGTFDIVIEGKGEPVFTRDLHLDKGMIYKVSPNPFENELKIDYGVFKKSMVGLFVYDMMGRQVAILEQREMTPEKYSAYWHPKAGLESGHYFIAIKINDLQVHYLKTIKKN